MKAQELRVYDAAISISLGLIEQGMNKESAAEKAANILKSEISDRNELINYIINSFE